MRTQGGRFLKIDHHEFGTPMWRSHCQYVAQIPIGVAKPAIHHNHVVQVNEIDNFGWSSKWNRSISKALLNILASCKLLIIRNANRHWWNRYTYCRGEHAAGQFCEYCFQFWPFDYICLAVNCFGLSWIRAVHNARGCTHVRIEGHQLCNAEAELTRQISSCSQGGT